MKNFLLAVILTTSLIASAGTCTPSVLTFRQYQCSCFGAVNIYLCQGYGGGCDPQGQLIACGTCWVESAQSCTYHGAVWHLSNDVDLNATANDPGRGGPRIGACSAPNFKQWLAERTVAQR
jgi:hypothetical protein